DYSDLIPAELVPDLEATETMGEREDLELFTETELDLNRRLSQVEDEQLVLAAGIGAERARWQKRVASLRADMTERNRLLAEREQEIENLSARLASLAVERDVFVEELRELQRSVGQAEVLENPRAPSPADAVIASLHERLSERGRALLAMREEIDRLRAERDQLVANIAERDEFIRSLHVKLRELEGGAQGGELRKLMRRFFGGEPKPEAPAAVAAEVAVPEIVAPEIVTPEATEPEAATPVPAAPTLELPIMDLAAFELPEPEAAAPAAVALDLTFELPQRQVIIEDMQQVPPKAELPASLRSDPGIRRYLIGLDMVGSVFELTLPRINIGRTRDNDLRIVDPTVSRLHAVLKTRGREVSVIDANSRNGVFVNGIQLRYAKLEDGDTLTFGAVRFRYRVGSGSSGGDFKPD
ncbi:MAG: FHA domain-containing protein, partial [Steroidobacteraceae bacterium]